MLIPKNTGLCCQEKNCFYIFENVIIIQMLIIFTYLNKKIPPFFNQRPEKNERIKILLQTKERVPGRNTG